MSGYGFGKKPASKVDDATPSEDRLDFSGIRREPLSVDPALEEGAIRRGAALGFVDRGAAAFPGKRLRMKRRAVGAAPRSLR
jgi:hypothetical protein